MKDFETPTEIANRWGVSREWVHTLIKDGRVLAEKQKSGLYHCMPWQERPPKKKRGKQIAPLKGTTPKIKKRLGVLEQYTKDWVFVRRWESIKEASKALGVKESGFCTAINSPRRSAGGYRWRRNDLFLD